MGIWAHLDMVLHVIYGLLRKNVRIFRWYCDIRQRDLKHIQFNSIENIFCHCSVLSAISNKHTQTTWPFFECLWFHPYIDNCSIFHRNIFENSNRYETNLPKWQFTWITWKIQQIKRARWLIGSWFNLK